MNWLIDIMGGRGYIVSELTISVETVRSHTRRIYSKFDVNTRVELLNATDS